MSERGGVPTRRVGRSVDPAAGTDTHTTPQVRPRSAAAADRPRHILAIDPGYERSAWLWLTDGVPAVIGTDVFDRPMPHHGIAENEELLVSLRVGGLPNGLLAYPDVVVIEQIESFGMAVGREVFETVRWAGRFEEASYPVRVVQMPRRTVKTHLCGSAKAKDPNVRQALIDRFGGDSRYRGTKASPGPLYGIAKDVWSALAIAVTHYDTGGAP